MATAQTFIGRKRVRKFFGKIQEVAEMPNLIEVQKASYDQFLQIYEPPGGRPDEGLQTVFKSRSEEHTSELQSRVDLVCRLLLEKKKKTTIAEINKCQTHGESTT